MYNVKKARESRGGKTIAEYGSIWGKNGSKSSVLKKKTEDSAEKKDATRMLKSSNCKSCGKTTLNCEC